MTRKDLLGCRQVNSKAINGYIHEQGLKQYWVAWQAGVHPSTLRRWMDGTVPRAELWRLVRLSTVLDVPVESLYLEEK